MGGLRAKYLLTCCGNSESISFDMQHGLVLKKLNFDILISRIVGGDGLRAKYLLACCCIRDSI